MLTPLDIAGKEFSRALNGYNRNDVDEFLNKISEQFEVIIRESDFVKTQVIDVEKKLTNYQEQENSLKDALLVAQITASDIKKRATIEAEKVTKQAELDSQILLKESKEESESMLMRAKMEVEKTLEQAKTDFKEIQSATVEIKRDYLDFKEKYQHVLREQINVLDRLVIKDELTD